MLCHFCYWLRMSNLLCRKVTKLNMLPEYQVKAWSRGKQWILQQQHLVYRFPRLKSSPETRESLTYYSKSPVFSKCCVQSCVELILLLCKLENGVLHLLSQHGFETTSFLPYSCTAVMKCLYLPRYVRTWSYTDEIRSRPSVWES